MNDMMVHSTYNNQLHFNCLSPSRVVELCCLSSFSIFLTLKVPITTNFVTPFPIFDKNKVWYDMRIVCQQRVNWPFQGGLLLWILFVICVSCLSWWLVCSLQPCGHLLGKGWPLGSFVWCLLVFCHFPIWCPGSGVVFDCYILIPDICLLHYFKSQKA